MFRGKGCFDRLTDEQVAIIRDAIGRGMTQDQAAFLAGIPKHRLKARLADQLVGCAVGRGRGPKRSGLADPTEEEIEAMKAAIRARNGHTIPRETSQEHGSSAL